MTRNEKLQQLEQQSLWDVIIIGGGASGLGAAVEAASRGYKTVLFEGVDFAKGTSSRSTKLLHGGVRYMANGDFKLVREALEERGLLRKNANHLFRNQTFVIPNYNWWGGGYYALGLTLYDLLSKRLSLGRSKYLSRHKTLRLLPNLKSAHLRSGVRYQDGKFDDARLAVNLAQTADDLGATVLNHCKVVDLIKNEAGLIEGVEVEDTETNHTYVVKAKVVINATGVFANKILKLDGRKKTGLKVVPSQGIHLVLDGSFLQSEHALMIPKTSDGRVLFAIPWHGKVVVGTTDTVQKKASYEPLPLEEEIDFILETATRFLTKAPTRADVLSVFAGLRPLVAPEGDKKNSKEISRGHKILVSDSNLITILGGKWTTYRKMAEDIIDKAASVAQWENRPSKTRNLAIHGSTGNTKIEAEGHWVQYGSDLPQLEALLGKDPCHRQKIHPDHPFLVGEVLWAVRHEMARTVEDVLARRVRLLFLDAKAAIAVTPLVAELIANETKRNSDWVAAQIKEFKALAQGYLLSETV